MDTGKWTKYGKRWVYLWERPIYEQDMTKSRADFNGQVMEIYYNQVTNEPVNTIASRKYIGRELQKLFNAKEYICYVYPSNALRGMEGFRNNVQFYYRASELPSEESMSKVEEIIEGQTVSALFKGTDAKTGEFEIYSYDELECDYNKKRMICAECEGTLSTDNKYKKKRTILGKTWTYAK